jgi:hypothetical protein
VHLRLPLSTRGSKVIQSNRLESAVWTGLELTLLALWTLYLLRNYFDFDRLMIPQGREYFVFIENHYMWERARECGPCAMWNGSFRGGFPAFVDVHNSMLYPPVIVASYIWGALNGTKAALIFTFFVAGFAQWWLGKVLGLGRIACVWSGAMAIAAGGLAGRMENGGVPIIISAACFALLFPPAIQLSRDGKRRTAALLGFIIGLALLSGHGYFQIAFPILSPLFLIFIIGNPLGVKLLIKRYLLATVIGVLIAAPFIVPFLHFYPSFEKRTMLEGPQSFAYVPLNLVIGETEFVRLKALDTAPFPYFYVNYIGWTAVIFAVIGGYALWRRGQHRLFSFLVFWSVGALWISSSMPVEWVRRVVSEGNPLYQFVLGVRHPSQFAELAIPTILALSAIGVDSLLKRRPTGVHLEFQVDKSTDPRRTLRLDLRWLLVIPLVFALSDVNAFSSRFLTLARQPIAEMEPVFEALETSDLQWVGTPFGEEYWMGQALEHDIKVPHTALAWMWKGKTIPRPVLQANRPENDPPKEMDKIGTAGKFDMYAPVPGNEYAAVTHAGGTRTICSAQGTGGNLNVTCDLSQPGRLEIKENYYSGWKATLKGDSLDVSASSGSTFNFTGDSIEVSDSSGWISVDLPAGKSTVELRYRPWDVPAGIVLMMVGLAVAGFCLIRREPRAHVADEKFVVDLSRPSATGEIAAGD